MDIIEYQNNVAKALVEQGISILSHEATSDLLEIVADDKVEIVTTPYYAYATELGSPIPVSDLAADLAAAIGDRKASRPVVDAVAHSTCVEFRVFVYAIE